METEKPTIYLLKMLIPDTADNCTQRSPSCGPQLILDSPPTPPARRHLLLPFHGTTLLLGFQADHLEVFDISAGEPGGTHVSAIGVDKVVIAITLVRVFGESSFVDSFITAAIGVIVIHYSHCGCYHHHHQQHHHHPHHCCHHPNHACYSVSLARSQKIHRAQRSEPKLPSSNHQQFWSYIIYRYIHVVDDSWWSTPAPNT